MKIERKKLFKIISAEILVCVIAAAVIGLALLFQLISVSDIIGKVFLSLLTLFIAGLFILNSINAVVVGNKFGIFAALMIVLSSALFLVLIWLGEIFGDFYGTYLKIVVAVAMISILFNLIISNYIVLGKKLLGVQIPFYLCFAYVELVLSFVIFGDMSLIMQWQIFVAAIIVALTLFVVLKVKEKNIEHTDAEQSKGNEEYVTITKTEYENLKAEIARLREAEKEKVVVAPIVNAASGVGSTPAGAAGVIVTPPVDTIKDDKTE